MKPIRGYAKCEECDERTEHIVSAWVKELKPNDAGTWDFVITVSTFCEDPGCGHSQFVDLHTPSNYPPVLEDWSTEE